MSQPPWEHVPVKDVEDDSAESAPSIENWPPQPQTLDQTAHRMFSVAVDCVLLIFPILFITLAVAAQSLNNHAVSQYGSYVLAACKLGPTIFPIVFTAISAEAFRRLAQRLLQNGERIGILEFLVGSQSLSGSVTHIVGLRSLHIPGIVVLAWWILSPLGGQSALRLLSVESGSAYGLQEVAFVNNNNRTKSFLTHSILEEDDNEPVAEMMAQFSATLLGAAKNREEPFDIWGNPKIPFIESLTDAGDGWHVVKNASQTQYSSLSGNRVQGICPDCKATFTMETSYLNLDCQRTQSGLRREHVMDSLGHPFYGWLPIDNDHPFSSENIFMVDDTVPNPDTDEEEVVRTESFLGTNYYFTPMGPQPGDVPTILYTTRSVYNKTLDYNPSPADACVYNCTLTSPKVEVEITCDKGSCGVSRMRKSLLDTRPDNWTPFHDAPKEIERLLPFFSYPANYRFGFDNIVSPTDNFIIRDYVSPFDPTLLALPDYRDVPDADVSKRLTQVLNSMRQISLSPFSIENGNTFKPLHCVVEERSSWLDLDWYNASQIIDNCPNMHFAQATVEREKEVYKTSRKWVAMLLFSSLALFVLGIVSIILKLTTNAPDILGYVSSLTRENPHMRVHTGGTALDGIQRARALHNMKVRVVDIKGYAGMGCIALQAVDRERDLPESAKLSNPRLYE